MRYDRTAKGRDEIAEGRKTLRGKLRTVLFLIDANKDGDELQRQLAQVGAPLDAIGQLVATGYVVELGAAGAQALRAAGGADPAAAFRIAKAFMNDTIVDARGIRAFAFTLKLERCATQQDLAALLPDYTAALLKSLDRNAVRALVDRTRELIVATG